MQVVDTRRLMGRNHLAARPLVVVELALAEGETEAAVREAYLAELARMRVAVGFPAEVSGLVVRPHRGGMVIGHAERIDVMLACAEASEWAALSAAERLAGRAPLALEPKRAEIEAILARDRSPRLLALEVEATRRGLPLLWDDEAVTVGMGSRSATWPREALPEVDDVEWERLARIPLALVTGTNGKTTSARWLGHTLREAGARVGVASSDAITVGDEVIETGDWTGPAAARLVLRRADVDVAVLETARGGILRRGLAVDRADVALITNIGDDHLGRYGIDDLAAMTRVKAVVAEAARGHGTVVLNGADARLVALADGFEGTRVVLFADLERRPEGAGAVAAHLARGGEAVVTDRGRIVRRRGEVETELGRVAEIPLAFGGAARFHVENALGVAAAASALGVSDDAIRRALASFRPEHNPRRASLVEKDGVRVVLDFGHNPDSVRAVLELAARLRQGGTGRLVVCLAGAGDRPDRELEDMAGVVADAEPHRVVVRELHGYLRGRAPGEVPALLRRVLVARGVESSAVVDAHDEVASIREALEHAARGDVIALFVHLDHAGVAGFLAG